MNKIFIVIEKFDREFPSIVTNTEGFPLLFDTAEQAQQEADDCQNGQVVQL